MVSSAIAASSSSSKANKLPILDIAKYYTNRRSFIEELRYACHKVGFFLIKHNFVDSTLTQQMLNETKQFFERPTNEKVEISYEHSPSFRGYMKVGVENTNGKLDYREQIEYAVEYPNIATTTTTTTNSSSPSWPVYERLKCKSNPWPNTYQPTLQPTTLKFAKEVCNIADIIRDSLCLALNLHPNLLKDTIFQSSTTTTQDVVDEIPHWVVKLISYPAAAKEETTTTDGNQQQGVGAHTDTNFLTMVAQDDIGGLQAFSEGEWIDVPTTDNTQLLVCNLGEQAEIWSRGYFLATPHRVLRNTSSTKHRISIPLFYNPVLSATIQPLDESCLENIEWLRPNDYYSTKHWRRKNNTMLSSVGENTFKSLARSHPTVFQKHHPDLILNEDGSVELRRRKEDI